ncbi:hypothetical protein Rt10032_c12g4865 [Rhodotorula toruloides]|uniref:Uncharacterized protein n=1 Tax=Rhodotorula toruloides TaxID=5286 RepID=A0A511KKE2_RHOTO|nr:hypothetical protein Rt10032_c12g4865 [Rhodotorula toruloides]
MSTNEANRVGTEAGEKSRDFALIDAATPFFSSSATNTSSYPPPNHPPVGHATSATSAFNATRATDTTRSSTAERISGAFGAVHGAGEAIRGTINSALDGIGDGIAGRPQGTVESRESARGEESVAQKGINEFNQGTASLKGDKGAAKTTTI